MSGAAPVAAPAAAPVAGPPAAPPGRLLARADRQAIRSLAAATSLHREWRSALASKHQDNEETARRDATSIPMTPNMTDDCLEVLVEQLLRNRPNIRRRLVSTPTQQLTTGQSAAFAYPANFNLAAGHAPGTLFTDLPGRFANAAKGVPPKTTNLVLAPVTLSFTDTVLGATLQRATLCFAVVSATRTRRSCTYFGIYESASHRPLHANLLNALKSVVLAQLGVSVGAAPAGPATLRSVRLQAAPDALRILNAAAVFLDTLADTCVEDASSLAPDFGGFCQNPPAITDPLSRATSGSNRHGGAVDWWEKMVIGVLMARVLHVTRAARAHHATLGPVNPYKAADNTPRVTGGRDNDSVVSANLFLDPGRLATVPHMSAMRLAHAQQAITTARSILETATLVRDGEYLGRSIWLDSKAISLVYDSFREELKFGGLDDTVCISEPASPPWLCNVANPTAQQAAVPFRTGPATATTLILTPTLGNCHWILVVVDMSTPVWSAVYYNSQGPNAQVQAQLQAQLRLLFQNQPQSRAGGSAITVTAMPMAIHQASNWICGYWVIGILRAVLGALAEGVAFNRAAHLTAHVAATEKQMSAGEDNLDNIAHDMVGRIMSTVLLRAGKHQPHLEFGMHGTYWLCPGRLQEERAWLETM